MPCVPRPFRLARAVQDLNVDVLVLAETAKPVAVLKELKAFNASFEIAEEPPLPHPKIAFYTRFPAEHLRPFRADGRLDVRRLKWGDRCEVLLGAIHFFDRKTYSPDEQAAKAFGVY